RQWAARPKGAWDRPLAVGLSVRAAIDLAEQTPLGRQLIYRQARKAVLNKTHGHYPAPLEALAAVEIGLEQGMAAGLEAEARAFGDLAVSDTAKNLIWLFLATQRQKRNSLSLWERAGPAPWSAAERGVRGAYRPAGKSAASAAAVFGPTRGSARSTRAARSAGVSTSRASPRFVCTRVKAPAASPARRWRSTLG